MDPYIPAAAAGGLAAGAALAWVICVARARARLARLEADTVHRTAEAEAVAASERSQRKDLEARVAAVESARAELDRELARTQERVEQSQRLVAEQKTFVEGARKDLETAFQALAGNALKGNSEQFLQLAEKSWATTREQAANDLDARRAAIEALLLPLKETLGRLDTKTGEIERAREGAYEALKQNLEDLQRNTMALRDQTTTLSTALRGSHTMRGRWGEVALKNVVELAGMTEHCDFEEQETVEGGGRPDMIVRLPGGRVIAIDSKVPLDAYIAAASETDDAKQGALLDRHAAALRGHVKALSAREYAENVRDSLDMVVLFLPGDPFLAAAFSRDPDMFVDALRNKVLITTPTSLLALLRTVAIYWQQQALAENAEAIANAAKELYERAAIFGEHLDRMGAGLKAAVGHYNDAVGSFQRRLIPVGRQLEEMKVAERARRRLEAPPVIEEQPREPNEQVKLDL